MSRKALWLIDGLCSLLFIFIMVVIFVLPSHQQADLAPLFSIVYRTGAWFIGAGLLFTCIWGKGKPGLILGIIMLVFYMITAFVTMFGLMALTVKWELLWYIHPVLIFSGCTFALWNRKNK